MLTKEVTYHDCFRQILFTERCERDKMLRKLSMINTL